MNCGRKPVPCIKNRRQRGQTILLVALGITTLLGMAALAIDVVSLYVARGEAQRAADAAALAGAKMFVNSQVTSFTGVGAPVLPGDVCSSSGAGGTEAVNRQAEAAAQQNLIAGQAATIQSITCTIGVSRNPSVSVTVQQTGLQNFFSRVWNRAGVTVRATATAEAYNSAGFNAPVQVSAVKPWLLPNCYSSPGSWGTQDCTAAPKMINTDGTIANPASFIGKTIELTQINCGTGGTPGTDGCNALPKSGEFYSMDIPQDSGRPVCASPDANFSCDYNPDAHDYAENIACANPHPLTCGQAIGGGTAVTVWTNGTASTNTRQTRHGARCLIHEDDDVDSPGNLDQGQDSFQSVATPPVEIRGGYNNPNGTLASANRISRSDSVVTVPVYDGVATLCVGGNGTICTTPTTIVGFLQLGIVCSMRGTDHCIGSPSAGPQPQVEAVVLNAVGCAPGAAGNPVTGAGTSPVTVRLIH